MTASLRKFGFELEVASNAAPMVATLHRDGLMATEFLHDYHCRCPECSFESVPVFEYDDEHECDDHCMDYGCWNALEHDCGRRNCPRRNRVITGTLTPPSDLRAQRDSTANGEFITRPITDWDDFRRITEALTNAANLHGAETNSRCGLHVHVDTSDDLAQSPDGRTLIAPNGIREQRRRIVPAAYLAFERYFTEIVAPGASIRKREMNSTLMQATRQFVSDSYARTDTEAWMDMGRGAVDTLLIDVIGRDRHVDLNWSRNHSTWEFRCFNATLAPWRIELACRLSVAFVEAAPQLRTLVEGVVRGSKFWPDGCDSPWGEIIRPAYSELPAPHPTKRPIVPMTDFIDAVCAVDPDLRPLIERQANYMLTRFATKIEVAA